MSKIEHPKLGRGEFPHIDGASAAVPKRKRGRPPKVYESPDANQRVLIKAKRGRRWAPRTNQKLWRTGLLNLLGPRSAKRSNYNAHTFRTIAN